MNNILVICTGNICRSPIAEALLKQEFPAKKIWSAGLSAVVGAPADKTAIAIGQENGLNLAAHRGIQVTHWMCQAADLILVMESAQKTQLEHLYPLVRGKVFRLGDIRDFDIADPYRRSREIFETAYADIARGVADWTPRIRQIG